MDYQQVATSEHSKDLMTHICKRLEDMELERSPCESVWNEITELVYPSMGTYVNRDTQGDYERTSLKRTDSTASVACRSLGARIIAEMTGSGSRWFDYRLADPELDKIDQVRRWLQMLSDKAFSILNSSGFRNAHITATYDWCAYGTACMYMSDEGEGSLLFRAIPIKELYIGENKDGEVDTVYRKFSMTLRQVVQMWGEEKFPERWAAMIDQKPDHKVTILHAVQPNADFNPHGMPFNNFRYNSLYIALDLKEVIHQGGYHRLPYKVFRFWKRTGEAWGGSPAVDSLADIRMLNAITHFSITNFQLNTAPPLAVAHDSVLSDVNMVPYGITYGALSADGRKMVDRLLPPTGGQQEMQQEIENLRMQIRSCFFVDPLINRQNSIRTAAEVQKRSAEEMIGITPFLTRFEMEYLTPALDDVLDFIIRSNPAIQQAIPMMVEQLKQFVPNLTEEQLIPMIEYSAPLAKTQRAQELNAVLQFLQVFQSMAAIDQSLVMHLDVSKTFSNVADLMGVPMDIITPPEVVEQQKAAAQAKQEQMEQQAMIMQGLDMAGNQLQGMAKAGLVNRQDLGLPMPTEGG